MVNRLVTALAVTVIAFSSAPAPAMAAAPLPSTHGCGSVGQHGVLPRPPSGMASLVEATLGPDCRLHVSAVQVVELGSIPSGPASGSGTYFYHQDPHTFVPGDPVATVYQRTWDCCNILMTALYTTFDWTATGSAVYANNQYNTVIYHREAGNVGGWNLDYQTLTYHGGCNGCWSATLHGEAGYWYQGSLDWSGQLFYNSYSNDMFGYGDGSWGCNYSWYWRNGAPGWSQQSWCANGSP